LNIYCVSGICQPATCTDGRRNGTETDVDCGSNCVPCDVGQGCALRTDCQTMSCVNSICAAPACNDNAQNGDETGPDCGGATCLPCNLQQCLPQEPNCTEVNVSLQSAGGVASASGNYPPNPPSEVNDGIANSSVAGWGNDNTLNSRIMVRFPATERVFRITTFWGGNPGIGGWGGIYLPRQYYIQISNDPTALASDAPNSPKWSNVTVASHHMTSTRGTVDTHVRPQYTTADYNTTMSVTFDRVNARAVRLVFDQVSLGGAAWIGQLGEMSVFAVR
jgi:hypothetical protein